MDYVKENSLFEKGVITGCDEKHEWMLPYWWKNYSEHNPFPVTFFDFGMTKSALKWCQARGHIQTDCFPAERMKEVSEDLLKVGEREYCGSIANQRRFWFSKPFALLNSPYRASVWIDIDCEIRGSVAPLFTYPNESTKFSIVLIQAEGKEHQNSGVIVAIKGSPVLNKWVQNALQRNDEFLGDDDLLSATIRENSYSVSFFPMKYNHPTLLPGHESAIIRHYVGTTEKWRLLRQI